MDKSEFERDRSIDPGQLDLEAVRQADTFFKWAERAIEAKSEVDRLKFALDIAEAKVQSRVREKPEDYGITRVTEAAIESAVKTSKRYGEAYSAYLEARKVSAILDAAVDAMGQKKRMIEILVTLHGQEYFAGPSVPHDIVASWKEHQTRIESDVNKAQKDRTRRRVRKED